MCLPILADLPPDMASKTSAPTGEVPGASGQARPPVKTRTALMVGLSHQATVIIIVIIILIITIKKIACNIIIRIIIIISSLS